MGKVTYNNIKLHYDIVEALGELEIQPKYPMRLKISTFYFINKNVSDSKFIDINVYFDDIENGRF